MSDAPSPPSIVEHLTQVIRNGSDLATKPALSVTAANVWVLKVRGALSRIYGKDAREVDAWCPPPQADRDRSPQDKLLQRLPALEQLARRLVVPISNRVFIGHGRSPEWLKLQTFLTRNLGLQCDEFNTSPTAGLQTTSRIDTMLSAATMAFLVMTGEDRHVDDTLHARQNVAHEIGLFQARLGHRRAIVMLENGCRRFSNLDGLTTIDFPHGDIMARSEEVRGVLSREHIL
jgi:hypothetical protein